MYSYLQAVELHVPSGHHGQYGMFDSWTKDRRPILYVHVYQGEDPPAPLGGTIMKTLSYIFLLHNVGVDAPRPRANEIRSMSVGDIVIHVNDETREVTGWFCADFGWRKLEEEAFNDAVRIAQRKAYGQVCSSLLPDATGFDEIEDV